MNRIPTTPNTAPSRADQLHSIASKQAASAAAMSRKAGNVKGQALATEAVQLAAKLGWGSPISRQETNNSFPVIFNFARGNRAIINADMSLSLVPAKKG